MEKFAKPNKTELVSKATGSKKNNQLNGFAITGKPLNRAELKTEINAGLQAEINVSIKAIDAKLKAEGASNNDRKSIEDQLAAQGKADIQTIDKALPSLSIKQETKVLDKINSELKAAGIKPVE